MDVYKEWLGIPEGERPPDHYTLLRLKEYEDDEEKIRRNYTKLNNHVRKYATGQYSVESQELLNELAKAMLCLTDPERKLEYDIAQGRPPEDQKRGPERKELTAVLVADGHISADQAKEVESYAEARGLSVRDAVVQMKLVDAETATRAYAQELGFGFVDLANTPPDDSVLDKVPRNLVKRHSMLPLFIDDDVLLVACVHEPTRDLEEELRLRYGVPMRPMVATPLAINQGIAKYYAPGMRDEAVAQEEAPAGKADKKSKAKKKAVKQKAAGNEPLDPDDAYQKKLMGILIMCWATIGSVLIDQFVIKKFIIQLHAESPWHSIPFPLTFIIPPIAILWVLKSYWK